MIRLLGAVAQLGERCNRTAEAEGSTPFRSTWKAVGRLAVACEAASGLIRSLFHRWQRLRCCAPDAELVATKKDRAGHQQRRHGSTNPQSEHDAVAGALGFVELPDGRDHFGDLPARGPVLTIRFQHIQIPPYGVAK